MKRIPIIDVFRGLSVLLVLAIHLGPTYITRPYSEDGLNVLWFKLWAAGGYGVPMFFLISGYLITRILAEGPAGLYRPSFRDFYARRIGRIVPLLVTICLLGTALLWSLPSGTSVKKVADCIHNPNAVFDLSMISSIATFTFNWYRSGLEPAHRYFGQHWDNLWSLAIEEQFYFFYPFLLSRIGNERRLVSFLIFIVLLGPLLGSADYLLDLKWKWGDVSHYGMIALGCLLYLVQEKLQDHLNDKDRHWLMAHGLFLVLLVLFHSHALVYVWLSIWGETLLGLGLFLILLGGMKPGYFQAKIWFLLRWPGELSYGIYLLHILVLFFLWDLLAGMDHFSAFFVFSLVTVVVARISYVFYEKPANRLVRRWMGAKP